MASVKSKNTSLEMSVRHAVHAEGFRYRLHCKALPGNPDLVFPRYRLVVFIHGCFWHGHNCPRGSRIPVNNEAYWLAKIGRNVRRDEEARAKLKAGGWKSRIIWGCEVEKGTTALLSQLRKLRDNLNRG